MEHSSASPPELVKKHRIGKSRLAETFGKPLAFGNAIQVRGMPQLFSLVLECLHQVRMAVAQRIDRYTCAKIKQGAAV